MYYEGGKYVNSTRVKLRVDEGSLRVSLSLVFYCSMTLQLIYIYHGSFEFSSTYIVHCSRENTENNKYRIAVQRLDATKI